MRNPDETVRSLRASSGLKDFVSVILRHRALIAELVARDVKGAHAAHSLGAVWIFVQPLVVVGTYMLIFGVVIGSKIEATAAFPGDYTSYILTGLVPWLITSNALGRAPSLLVGNANLVKQVVFPIETMPVASVVACFIIFIPSIVLMAAYKLFAGAGLTPIAMLLPLVLCLHGMFTLGLMLALSVTTPFLRDIRELVTVYLAISMYFTPSVYLPDWVPRAIRPILYLNPFSYVVWVYQDVLFFGRISHGFAWIVFALMAIGAMVGGLFIFRKLKPYLGNVL